MTDEQPRGPSRSAEDLLDAGLEILAQSGIRQLTIDALCRRLSVTKGSFYHHFRNRREFLERLLGHWTERWTHAYIVDESSGLSAAERLRAITDQSQAVPWELEVAMRVWAKQDPLALASLERVDATRMAYLQGIFESLCGDAREAAVQARMSYALYVGARMIAPPLTEAQRREMADLLQQDFYGTETSGT